MRLVEDHRIAGRQQFGQAFIAQHDIGEKQMVVHDDDVGAERFFARIHHETFVEVRALAAQTIFSGRCDVAPDRGGLRHVGQLAPVAGCRCTSEGLDAFQIAHVSTRGERAICGRAL